MLTNLDKLGTVSADSIWIVGGARSGKTARLVEQFCVWSKTVKPLPANVSSRGRSGRWRAGQTAPAILVLAANGDNRLELADRIAIATEGKYAFHSTTPFGFFEQEVLLFWPLLLQSLDLKAQFPLRLQPETELELAARLWRRELDEGILQQTGVSPNRMVRRTLDLLQLAAVSGTPREEIPHILQQGFAAGDGSNSLWTSMGELLERWREWCLTRGLLTYGIVCELYWRYLLPNVTYQQQLASRYQAVIADDVDDYPAISRHLFDRMLDTGAAGAFSYNRDGGVRLGLGADTEYLAQLESRCGLVEKLDAQAGLSSEIGDLAVSLAVNSDGFYPLGEVKSRGSAGNRRSCSWDGCDRSLQFKRNSRPRWYRSRIPQRSASPIDYARDSSFADFASVSLSWTRPFSRSRRRSRNASNFRQPETPGIAGNSRR
jgi:hypothetical protein